MKVSIKKIKSPSVKEWLILIDGKTMAICLNKADAKFIVKCIKKYKQG